MNKLNYLKIQLLMIFTPILVIGSFCWLIDPYYIWHDSYKYYLHSPALDVQSRYIKPIQALLNKSDALIIGSSRVYRGFNMEAFKEFGSIRPYNYGISSLKMDEALAILKNHVIYNTPKMVILGLDFWMFHNDKLSKVIVSKNKGYYWLLEDIIASLISLKSIKNSYNALRYKKHSEDGYWEKNGFHFTHKRNLPTAEKMLTDYNTYLSNQDTGDSSYFQNSINDLKKFIVTSKEINTNLIIYISPLHPKTWEVYQNVDLNREYESWRKLIKEICLSYDVEFFDFTPVFLNDNKSYETDDNWLDYSHFSPKVGDQLLKRMLN